MFTRISDQRDLGLVYTTPYVGKTKSFSHRHSAVHTGAFGDEILPVGVCFLHTLMTKVLPRKVPV